MFRGQVYNTSPWDSPQIHQPHTRRPQRRNKGNAGLLDRSRQSNNSNNSIKLKRTQRSGERINLSRDRELNSQQISGITSEGVNDSYRRVPRRMGSVLSLNRRRLPQDGNRIQAAGSRTGKNVVENLYMLTNNVPQYDQHLPTPHSPTPYDEVYNNNQHYDKRDRYQRIAERRPQQRSGRYPPDSPHRYHQPSPRKYPQQLSNGYPQRSPRKYPEQSPHRYADRSQEKYREDGYRGRSPSPSGGSVLRSRRSKQSNGLRGQRSDGSRDKGYKPIGNSRDASRRYPENQMQRLQQKYTQNIYELNNVPKHRIERRDRDPRSQDRYYKVRGGGGGDGRYQEIHEPPRNYNRDRKDRGRYPEEREVYRQDRRRRPQKYRDQWYQEQEVQRDLYREEGGYRQDVYHQRGGQSRRRHDKLISNNSGKYNPYYQEQIPSTTVGIKTLPQISRYDTISDASIPIHSIRSHKELPKNTYAEQLPQKKSVKLDRPKDRQKMSQKQKQKQKEWRSPYEESNLEDRWKKNNIQLQERGGDQWDKKKKKQRIIDDRYQPANLPSGSMFLPVQSKRLERRDWAEDITQKVIVHLQSLNLIADYTKEFKKMYQNLQPWEILIFLSYKKFYMERTKITTMLKSASNKQYSDQSSSLDTLSKQNPFTLPYSKISDEQIKKFRETKECFALMIELENQNKQIRDALRGLYNRYIQKSGEHVNMLDCDNFSDQIYKDMKEELEGIAENISDPDLQTATRLRMGKIIKVALLISFLNGKYIKNFPQILIHEDMIKIGKRETLRQDSISKLFLSEFKRVLS